MGIADSDLDAYRPPVSPQIVRFSAISEAWNLVQDQWSVWALAVLIVIAGNWLVSGLVYALLGLGHRAPLGGFRGGIPTGGAMLQVVLGAIINGFFMAGMLRMACRQVRREPIRVEDLFSVVDVLAELVLGVALYSAAVIVAGMLCFIPSLLVQGLLMFTVPLIVDRRLSATDAIKYSFGALKSEWLAATAFHLVISVLSG